MKKLHFICLAALAATFVACEPNNEPVDNATVVTFENVALDSTGYWNGSDFSGGKLVDGAFFVNDYVFDSLFNYGYCNGGFYVSSKTDKQTRGYLNEYSVYADGGADNSKQFAVLYYSAWSAQNARIQFTKAVSPKNISLTNSTYTYWSLKEGDAISKACAAGDWFKVTIIGQNGDTRTDSLDFYLADFRDGKTFICDTWTSVDLSALGAVTDIYFTIDGTDKGDWGLNTPAYVCLDNLKYE